MSFDFECTQGDGGKVIHASLFGADGGAVDLTLVDSVRFVMGRYGDAPLVNAAATPDPDQGTNPGVVRYTLTTTNLANDGQFLAQFVATWAGSIVHSFPTVPLSVRVHRKLAAA